MEITATELKLNLGKYLDAVNDEVITITKNGKPIAFLAGTRTYKYDLSELEEFERQMKAGYTLGEATAPAYGTGSVAGTGTSGQGGAGTDEWLLTHNGQPVATFAPAMKEKKKRRLGFISGPQSSPETEAALFEPCWTDEEYEEWLNKEI